VAIPKKQAKVNSFILNCFRGKIVPDGNLNFLLDRKPF
jgi:hypothetical protein